MGESSISALLMLTTAAFGQSPDLSRAPLLPPSVLTSSDNAPSSPTSPSRLRLFRIQPGFVSESRWLELDDRAAEPDSDPGPDWVSVMMGNDNPYFDFRRPGDPGGVGFSRLETQVQLFDSERTSFALGFQAVTPRGIEAEGLADRQGPTVVTPALAIYHQLEEGTAVQAFVGKNVPLSNRAAQPIRRNVQYGVALQRPLSTEGTDPLSTLFVSLGALGQLRDGENDRGPIAWELMPGLHWKPAQTWWMSAGYAVPMAATRPEAGGYWQLTCSWQY